MGKPNRRHDGEISPYRFALVGVAALAVAGGWLLVQFRLEFQRRNQLVHGHAGAAGGGMSKLIAAAKKEGKLNVIALPPDLGQLRHHHQALHPNYGIKVNSANPDGSSQQEVDAIKQKNGTASRPRRAGRRPVRRAG